MMAAITITQVERADHLLQLRELLGEYFIYLDSMSDEHIDLKTIPVLHNFDAELANLPGVFSPPGGRFLVALDADRVIGCAALKPVNETTGEINRMYVKPAYRGQGIGGRLLDALLDAAREIGYIRLNLESHRDMTSAHRLYRRAGFRIIPTPDDMPDFVKANAVFMTREEPQP